MYRRERNQRNAKPQVLFLSMLAATDFRLHLVGKPSPNMACRLATSSSLRRLQPVLPAHAARQVDQKASGSGNPTDMSVTPSQAPSGLYYGSARPQGASQCLDRRSAGQLSHLKVIYQLPKLRIPKHRTHSWHRTGIVTLGTALTGLAISSELYVVNEESIVFGGFVLLAGYIASAVRAPYREWADGQISVGICRHFSLQLLKIRWHEQKITGILNATRAEHTQAVQSRIDSVGEMKDVVGTTKALFAMSKVLPLTRLRESRTNR